MRVTRQIKSNSKLKRSQNHLRLFSHRLILCKRLILALLRISNSNSKMHINKVNSLL